MAIQTGRHRGRVMGAWLLAALIGMTPVAPAHAAPGETAVADIPQLPARPAPDESAPVMQQPGVDTLATIRRRGTLRVGVVPTAPMARLGADGRFEGFSVDLMRRMAEDMDIGVEFLPTTALFMLPELLDGRFDLIATGLWVTTQRAMLINFTEPTTMEGIHLVASRALAGGKRKQSDFDQRGVRLAVFSNTVQEKLARRLFPRATVVRVDGSSVAAVLQGLAHAALVPTLSPEALLKPSGKRLFLPLGQPLSSTPVALGVRKGDADFVNFLNTWLSLRRGEGWLEERARFWAQAEDLPR